MVHWKSALKSITKIVITYMIHVIILINFSFPVDSWPSVQLTTTKGKPMPVIKRPDQLNKPATARADGRASGRKISTMTEKMAPAERRDSHRMSRACPCRIHVPCSWAALGPLCPSLSELTMARPSVHETACWDRSRHPLISVCCSLNLKYVIVHSQDSGPHTPVWTCSST